MQEFKKGKSKSEEAEALDAMLRLQRNLNTITNH